MTPSQIAYEIQRLSAELNEIRAQLDEGSDEWLELLTAIPPPGEPGTSKREYIEPFGIKHLENGDAGAKVAFYLSGLAGHATGMTQFKGAWYAVTDDTSPDEAGNVTLTESRAFYLEATITASAGEQTIVFVFKSAATFPAGDDTEDPNVTIEIIPLWYIPVTHTEGGPYTIDEDAIEHWTNMPVISGIS